jgi:hypothetical protein
MFIKRLSLRDERVLRMLVSSLIHRKSETRRFLHESHTEQTDKLKQDFVKPAAVATS